MPRNRKVFIHKQVLFLTTRMETGLPLVPNKLINTILWSILSRAAHLYDVKICHFIFMSNHFHMLVVVNDPEHLPRFMRHIKTESAHAVNRLIGRSQRTVWLSGYDSPPILTLSDCLRYIKYIYLNPVRANLVESIDDYPGVSSWQMFKTQMCQINCFKIRRETIEPLHKTRLSKSEANACLNEILDKNGGEQTFFLEPFAFMECFDSSGEYCQDSVQKAIYSSVIEEQSLLSLKRKFPILGVNKLIHQDIDARYEPRLKGKKMICISSDVRRRKNYISWFKNLSKIARSAYSTLIATGTILFPPGVFMPGGCMCANINPHLLT